MNQKISIPLIQERCLANISLKKMSYFSAHSTHAENICVLSNVFTKQSSFHSWILFVSIYYFF